mgnify:CR=1 FL=1
MLGGIAATVPVHLTTAVVLAEQWGRAWCTDPHGRSVHPRRDGSRRDVAGPAGRLGDLVLKVGCQANPVPDLDQFALAPTFTSFAGVLSATRAKLRGTLAGVS